MANKNSESAKANVDWARMLRAIKSELRKASFENLIVTPQMINMACLVKGDDAERFRSRRLYKNDRLKWVGARGRRNGGIIMEMTPETLSSFSASGRIELRADILRVECNLFDDATRMLGHTEFNTIMMARFGMNLEGMLAYYALSSEVAQSTKDAARAAPIVETSADWGTW